MALSDDILNARIQRRDFERACIRAQEQSKSERCTQYVNGRIIRFRGFTDSTVYAFRIEFHVSDWYNCDSTCATYTDGKKHD